MPEGAGERSAAGADAGAQGFDEAAERIPELISTLGEHTDSTVRQNVDELLQSIDRVHREALARLAGLLQHHDLLGHACGDPIVGTLFDLYDLAPPEEEEPPPPPPAKTRVVTSFGAGPAAPKGSAVIGLQDLKRFPVQGPAARPAAVAPEAPAPPSGASAEAVGPASSAQEPPASPAPPTASAPQPPAATPEPAAPALEPSAATPEPPAPAAGPPAEPSSPSAAQDAAEAVPQAPAAPPGEASVPVFRPGQYPVASFPEGSARASSSWEPPSPGGSAAAVGKAALEMGMAGLPGFGVPQKRPKDAEADDATPVEPDPTLALPQTGGASFDPDHPMPTIDADSPFGFDLLGGGMESLKSRPVRPGTLPPAAAGAPAAARSAAAPAPSVPASAPTRPSDAEPAADEEWTPLFSTDYVPVDTVAASSDQRVLVINSDGKFHAVLNRCGGGPLPLTFSKVEGNRLHCPWHQDCDYDIARGEAANGRRLVIYPVRVEDGIIQVALAKGWATGPLTPEQRVTPIR